MKNKSVFTHCLAHGLVTIQHILSDIGHKIIFPRGFNVLAYIVWQISDQVGLLAYNTCNAPYHNWRQHLLMEMKPSASDMAYMERARRRRLKK